MLIKYRRIRKDKYNTMQKFEYNKWQKDNIQIRRKVEKQYRSIVCCTTQFRIRYRKLKIRYCTIEKYIGNVLHNKMYSRKYIYIYIRLMKML